MNADFERRLSTSMEPSIALCFRRIIDALSPMCGSEIEILLGSAILAALRFNLPDVSTMCSFDEIGKFQDVRCMMLVPQYPFKNYRIDFALVGNRPEDSFREMIFIECDGHDFHERTKEQAGRDRKKDRDIQIGGIPLLRFTGSEIFRDPFACVVQIFKLYQKIKEAHGSLTK